MTESSVAPPMLERGAIDDCWNRIGVRGDGSCPELPRQIHCHNCPVYSAGAADLLDADPPAGYLSDRTAHFATVSAAAVSDTRAVVIFRAAAEWLALPTSVVIEVANPLPIHSLPHRSNSIVLGLASVRGELLVCVSLHRIVGAEQLTPASGQDRGAMQGRLLVIRQGAVRVVCPVDEVHGIHRYHPQEQQPVPATVAKATVTYSTALLPWQGRSVGLLDDELLFYTLRRSLA